MTGGSCQFDVRARQQPGHETVEIAGPPAAVPRVRLLVARGGSHLPGILALVCSLGLSACGLGGTAQYPQARLKGQTAPQYAGSPSILGTSDLNSKSAGAATAAAPAVGVGVNNNLWRAALEQVSAMPLISEDPVGGVIITDWYSKSQAPNERMKLNVYIFGRDLRADSVRVATYRQQRDKDGNWIDQTATRDDGAEIETAILSRARELNTAQLGQ